jgi:hypothetical protein
VVPGTTSATCNRISPCKCSFTDGGKTWHIDISGYFDYPTTPTSDDLKKYIYTYTCDNNPCPKNPNSSAVACQYVKSQSTDYPLGKVDQETTWEVTDPSDSSLTFVINYKKGQKDKKTRETTVTFKYATGSMKMEVTKEVNTNTNINYEMEVSGNKVKKFSPSGGKGKSGGKKDISGPIGIVLILLAIIGLLTYFIVGGVYLYRVKGARGKEVIIHYSFWTGLPLLIKEGFFFTISPCYKRSSYQSL